MITPINKILKTEYIEAQTSLEFRILTKCILKVFDMRSLRVEEKYY